MVRKDLVDLNSEDGSEFFRAMNGLNFDGVEWACQRGGFVSVVGSGRVDPQVLIRGKWGGIWVRLFRYVQSWGRRE